MTQNAGTDYAQLVPSLFQAAAQGDPKAQLYLGVLYNNGQGLPQDYGQAAAWFFKAAEQGEPKAQYYLGLLYYHGQGVAQNFEQARAWIFKAAVQGDGDARDMLGRLHAPQAQAPSPSYPSYPAYARQAAQPVAPAPSPSPQSPMAGASHATAQNNPSGMPIREGLKNSERWMAATIGLLIGVVFCLAGVILFGGGRTKAPPPSPPQVEETRRPEQQPIVVPEPAMDYAALTEKVLPSIVRIDVNKGFDQGVGSGFFVSDMGDILTNYHVIEGAREILVIPHEGESFYAMIKDVDEENDMALLTMRYPETTPFLKISDALPRQGEAVMALGSPKGLDRTVSNGIVSAFRGKDNKFVQFTAPISPGSSGGALLNARGEVVGMPTMQAAEGQNLNFAISPTILLRFFEAARYKTPRATSPMATRRSEPIRASQGESIPLPNERGFRGHNWGCSVESIKKYVAGPLKPMGNSRTAFSTLKTFKAFRLKIDAFVVYEFKHNRLGRVILIPDSRDAGRYVNAIVKELSELYRAPRKSYNGGHTFYSWSSKNLDILLSHPPSEDDDILIVDFRYRPIWGK